MWGYALVVFVTWLSSSAKKSSRIGKLHTIKHGLQVLTLWSGCLSLVSKGGDMHALGLDQPWAMHKPWKTCIYCRAALFFMWALRVLPTVLIQR